MTVYNSEMLSIIVDWLTECIKYGAFFGIIGYCAKMLIKAFSGKVDFF